MSKRSASIHRFPGASRSEATAEPARTGEAVERVGDDPSVADAVPASDAAHASGVMSVAMPRHIGQVLRALGKLEEPQIEAVLAMQQRNPARFGDLAIRLGLVTQADVGLALIRQSALDEVIDELPSTARPGATTLDEADETLIAVRSQLVHRWFGVDLEQRALAIVSPDHGDGRTYVCAQLGRLFAELGDDTLLIDADLRRPGLHAQFGGSNELGLSSYLLGEIDEVPVRPVAGVRHLHLLPAGPRLEAPHSLIGKRRFALMFEMLAPRYKAIIVDTPAIASGLDAVTIALRTSGALLVVRKNRTRMADVRSLKVRLSQLTVEVVGALINDSAKR